MILRVLCAVVIAVACGEVAFAADKGLGLPPPPKSLKEKDVNTWVARYIDAPEEDIFAWMEESVMFVDRKDLRVTPANTIRFWSRSEAFAPLETEVGLIRSSRFLYEVDCQGERVKTLAVDSYGQNNLLGDPLEEIDEPNADWSYPRPNTAGELIVDHVCEYAAEAAEQAKETPTGLKGAPFR